MEAMTRSRGREGFFQAQGGPQEKEAAENSHKGIAALPSPCGEGCGLLSASSTAAPSGLQLARVFGEHAPPTHKPAGPTPHSFLHPPPPRVREQVELVSSFRRRTPRAEPQSPPPRSLGPAARPRLLRALPATLRRGEGPDTAALASGRAVPKTASLPTRVVVSLIWDPSQ